MTQSVFMTRPQIRWHSPCHAFLFWNNNLPYSNQRVHWRHEIFNPLTWISWFFSDSDAINSTPLPDPTEQNVFLPWSFGGGTSTFRAAAGKAPGVPCLWTSCTLKLLLTHKHWHSKPILLNALHQRFMMQFSSGHTFEFRQATSGSYQNGKTPQVPLARSNISEPRTLTKTAPLLLLHVTKDEAVSICSSSLFRASLLAF